MREGTCLIGGCQSQYVVARGLCESHYRKAKRSGELDNYPKIEYGFVECSIEDCTNEAKARGWCKMHWSRWNRHGSPFANPWPGPAIDQDAETAVCRDCGIEKPLRQFLTSNKKSGARRVQPCQKCNYERYPHVYNGYTDRNRVQKRMKALIAYGGKCVCCGEAREYFLQLDHVFNDGKKHREEIGTSQIWWWLEKNGYPADRFQILCANCHIAKTKIGFCPCQTSPSLCRPSLDGTDAEKMWNAPGASERLSVAA